TSCCAKYGATKRRQRRARLTTTWRRCARSWNPIRPIRAICSRCTASATNGWTDNTMTSAPRKLCGARAWPSNVRDASVRDVAHLGSRHQQSGRTMSTRALQVLCGALVLMLPAAARAQSGYDLFQQALTKERAEGKLEEAIQIY